MTDDAPTSRPAPATAPRNVLPNGVTTVRRDLLWARPAATQPDVLSTGGIATRRDVLRAGLTAAAALALSGTTLMGWPATAAAAVTGPFALGVASGEPAPDGMVLWTRLAVDPLAADGLGGMGLRRTEVEWELARDERFTRLVRRGVETTGPEAGHSMHVEIAGLDPGREYFYRFRAAGEISPPGRTRTAPGPEALGALTMCFASCAQYEHGLFTAYRRLAEDEPSLVLHLGDYLYERGAGESPSPGGNVRSHVGPEMRTLAQYRQRYAQYKSDPDLQAAHAVAPWLVVLDDHELENNWAGEIPEEPKPGTPPSTRAEFLARRAAALQAYWENMPLRDGARPTGIDMQLYRRVRWGALATFHLLDTRQYRGDQPCGDTFPSDCPQRSDPARSLPGSAQEQWLAEGFRNSRTRWDMLGQQVFFAQLDLTPGPARGFNPDAWDGYPGSRDRVVDAWTEAKVRNPVVLSGDIHAHWAAEVKRRFDDPGSPVVGSELVTTSITSGGDGSTIRPDTATTMAENPHLRFYSNRRGYVRARLTPASLTADFRALPYVSKAGAPARTAASFVVEDRRAGLQRA